MDDPWDWDVDKVVQELCSANRSWEPPTSTALQFLPPPEKLEPLLREHGVDGHTLLTYDRAELCQDLCIRIAKHKSILKHIISSFRSRSKQYRLYQKRSYSEFEAENDEGQTGNSVNREVLLIKPTSRNPLSPLSKGSIDLTSERPQDAPQRPPLSNIHEGPHPGVASTTTPYRSNTFHDTPSYAQETPTPHTPATKKRKVAPTLISTEIDVNMSRTIPSEADVIIASRSRNLINNRGNDAIDSTWAYLGKDALTRVDIVEMVNDAEPFSKDMLQEERQLAFVQVNRLPYGRRLQINQLLKRRMLRNRKPRVPYAIKLDMVPGANNPDHDKILPLYGDSDEEYDSETWAEIETEQLKQKDRRGLSGDEVQAVIDESIQKFVSDWRERKASKLLYKSNQIWLNARRAGLKMSIDKNRSDFEACESRIAKYCREMTLQHWRKIAELKMNTLILQQSVEDREYASWVLSVITTPTEPEKLLAPPRTSVRTRRQSKLVSADSEDEEILTSESENELDGFVVDDPSPPGASRSGSPMAIFEDDTPPVQQERRRESDQNEVSMDFKQIETIDLTQSPQTPVKSQKYHVIDLTTPVKPKPDPNSSPRTRPSNTPGKIGQLYNEQSPLIMSVNDLDPAEQMIAKELAKQDEGYLSYIFSVTMEKQSDEAWIDFLSNELEERRIPKSPYDTPEKQKAFAAFTMLRLFEIYRDDNFYSISQYKKLSYDEIVKKAEDAGTQTETLNSYANFLRRLSDRFEWKVIDTGIADRKSPSKQKRRRKLVRNQEAESLREHDRARAAEQKHRQEVLRAKFKELEAQGVAVLDQKNMIINESKEDDQGFIYIHPEIARRIKEHQVAGVRFMWNQIVDSRAKQGCLLAHTMGLGKTMQIITLLVAIAEAAGSEEKSISCQIPKGLKESKTLVLCPPSLVNNWMDELLSWAPQGHRLGEFFKVDQSADVSERDANIESWDERGGILIFGYNLFKDYVLQEDFREILCDGPNLVVADEAHTMKNPKSQTHAAGAHFRTLSRIALTGSPLANRVEEYHAMVNWIAPNYLSDISEFRSLYANPIKEGLKLDSTMSQRRMALKMLRVLKEEVAPKVQRITIAALKHDIPTKLEFLLTVPLTNVQREAYETFISYQLDHPGSSQLASIDTLGILCAHPSIFMKKLQDRKQGSTKSIPKAETLPSELITSEITLLHKTRDLGAYALSWKILILLSILDECKRIGDSVLIFSQSIRTLDYIESILKTKRFSYERIDGKVPTTKRQSVVKEFSKGKVDVFLISTRAGGVGLNMTSANRVIIFDVKFNPQNEQQAVGRAYRIGQKKPVYVYRLVCGGTSEEKALNMAIWKMQLASRVVDQKNPIPKAQEFGQSFEMPTEPKQQNIDTHIGKDNVLDKVIEAHKDGIRAITMMDTFEEEELEDAVLTAEDRAEADLLIAQNEARRLGKPIPPLYSMNQGRLPNEANRVMLQTPVVDSKAQNDQVLDVPPIGSSNILQAANPPQNNAVLYQPDLLRPIQGTTTHIRRSQQNSGHVMGSQFTNWENQPAFKGELTRAFSMSKAPHDDEQKRSAAHAITAAVWDRQRPSEQHAQVKWEIMTAASSPRFVEAICLNLLSTAELADMEPSDIATKRHDWDKLTEAEWEEQKAAAARKSEADPEHLQYALHQMSSTPKGENSGRRKPLRLDDQEALETVIENRKAKQSSHANPRLPSWAIDAVTRQGRTSSPSIHPSAGSSSHLSPKNPFK
ncbi:P-loop containing nucleoside triphosphate hydrolase protein [Daldinia loculata]|uniref:P-loop containing nucleoside triphosphate hydrolase protein n=1 Tax=Daldinia loculata TaxID=103429 RepID=UPI0020C22170|nr:P-loop containing nucleoside triphosphate hydrolase protein [Daldinia loculata]KAI1644517.1 P-loop containing nucleoside triphosphate hydrolase protein [Daldinia loculata]